MENSTQQNDLTPTEYAEIASILTDQTGVRITAVHAAEILTFYPHAKRSFAKYGGDDTGVCDQLADSIARYFLGCDWPIYGDNADMDDFIKRLKNAANVMGYTCVDESNSMN